MSKAMRAMLIGAAAAGSLACGLNACVGEDPLVGAPGSNDGGSSSADASAPSADAATGDGGGSDAGAPLLPLIDQYSISHLPRNGSHADCVNRIDIAVKAMGGGYVPAASVGSFARYADRSGATVIASCIEGAGQFVTESWAIKTAANAQTDEARLLALVNNAAAIEVSPAGTSFPKLEAGQRILTVGGTLPLPTCRTRAKAAIDAAVSKLPASPNKWSAAPGDFLAVGGTDGASASISCLADTGYLVVDALTIDKAITTAFLLDTVETAFNATN